MLRSLFSLPRRPSCFSSRNKFACKMSTKAAPLCPNFVSVRGDSTTKPHGIRFRLVSYNILAQAYVKSAFFPHSPSPCLKWKARSQAILTILRNLGADFLCLQELDEYDSFYKKNIESCGYSSVYIQRSGQKHDGCGIFYKESCAELLLEERIEYNDLSDSIKDESTNSDDKDCEKARGCKKETKNDEVQDSSKTAREDRGDPNDPRVRLKRDCVGIMAAFRIKDPFHHIIIVANTHIYWDPEWADVKLAQVKYLLSRLAKFKILVSDKFEGMASVIVSGDFNSTPGDKVYQYLVSRSTSSAEVECSDELPISLCSVYGSTGGEPPFTNCTPDFTNTLDYILFS